MVTRLDAGRPAPGRAVRFRRKRLAVPTLVLGSLLAAPGAGAATVLAVSTSHLVGPGVAPSIDSFTVTTATTATVTLSDLTWPDALQSLSFKLVSASGTVIGTASGMGTDTFSLSGPGTYYALAYGQAAPGGTGLSFGSFGIDVSCFTPTPVALPATLWLLAGGLILVGAHRRRSGIPELTAIKV